MELLLTRMKRHFPKLNKQPYGLDHVTAIAKRKGASVELAPYGENILGYFCIKRRRRKVTKHIVVNSLLGPVMRDFIALHEICHFLYHAPASSYDWYYCKKAAEQKTKRHDCEADFFALIALIPLPVLMDLHRTDGIDDELMELCVRRNKIWLEHNV